MKSKESEDEQVNYMFFFLNNNESSLQRTINKRSVALYLCKYLLKIFFIKKKKKNNYNSHRSLMSLSKDYTRQLNFIHKIPMSQFHC